MLGYNRVHKMVDKGDHYEVKVKVETGARPYVALRVFKITKEVCAKKNFTPRVGTKFRTGGWAECPWRLFGGRNLQETQLRWEDYPGTA